MYKVTQLVRIAKITAVLSSAKLFYDICAPMRKRSCARDIFSTTMIYIVTQLGQVRTGASAAVIFFPPCIFLTAFRTFSRWVRTSPSTLYSQLALLTKPQAVAYMSHAESVIYRLLCHSTNAMVKPGVCSFGKKIRVCQPSAPTNLSAFLEELCDDFVCSARGCFTNERIGRKINCSLVSSTI